MKNNEVTRVPAASAEDTLRHHRRLFAYEADCWDVHAALEKDDPGFVLIDVRSRELYDAGHVPGAVHLPHGKMTAARVDALGPTDLHVVYCAGPHCNGASRGAIALAELGRPVKIMVGGIEGWKDEGFSLQAPAHPTA